MASFSERMWGAVRLDVATYEEVEHDRTATGQAAGVVALAAVASAIGAAGGGTGLIIGSVVSAFVGWVVWAGVTLVVGTRLFDGRADFGEMLRALGFAQAVAVLNVFGVIPGLGVLVRAVVLVWVLVCGIVAVRQALDFDTARALGTVLVGWLAMAVLILVLGGLGAGLRSAL